jgi:hypothetical protein
MDFEPDADSVRRSPLEFSEVKNIKKPAFAKATAGGGGERGIRTPGPVTVNGFQDRRIRPLCHLSGAKIGEQGKPTKKWCKIVLLFTCLKLYFQVDNPIACI